MLSNIIMIMSKYWKVFLVTGVGYTLLLSFLTVSFGTILGILICLARMSNFKPAKALCSAIVDIIRGTPMLLQIYVGYFMVPKILPFKVSEFMAVAVAFAINSGCYLSEAFRSGRGRRIPRLSWRKILPPHALRGSKRSLTAA